MKVIFGNIIDVFVLGKFDFIELYLEKNLISAHQFGLTNQHSTLATKFIGLLLRMIEKTLEERKICASVNLDVSQALARGKKLKTCCLNNLWKFYIDMSLAKSLE